MIGRVTLRMPVVFFVFPNSFRVTVLKRPLLRAPLPCPAQSPLSFLGPHTVAVWLHRSAAVSGALLAGSCLGQEVPL